jgi:hypothetical protein
VLYDKYIPHSTRLGENRSILDIAGRVCHFFIFYPELARFHRNYPHSLMPLTLI